MKSAILCVDDEPIVLVSLKQELKTLLGTSVSYETATSAEVALEILTELVDEGIRVILVFSDWLMPGIRGDEFLERVHRLYPDIRAVMITGQADQQALERVRQNPAVLRVLSKPWRASDLNSILDEVLRS